MAVADEPPASVAVTVEPEIPFGTANVQLNVPSLFVVSEPVIQLVIAIESSTSDASGVETENPVPFTVTVSPDRPWVGVTVMAGAVTRNENAGVVPEEAWSMPRIEYDPGPSDGTTNVQSNRPLASVVISVPENDPSVHAVGVRSAEPNDTVTVEDALNPEPATEYTAPIGPWLVPTPIDGSATVTSEEAAEVALSAAVAESVTSISKVYREPGASDPLGTVHWTTAPAAPPVPLADEPQTSARAYVPWLTEISHNQE